jgi:hypothetical protein
VVVTALHERVGDKLRNPDFEVILNPFSSAMTVAVTGNTIQIRDGLHRFIGSNDSKGASKDLLLLLS